jgi:transcriptional regulator of acetoin/glycerol metabolism/DNA-binding CsgD family transcriptional regulator
MAQDRGRPSPTLRSILERVEEAGPASVPLRDDIVASWERSALAGLTPDRFDVPYEADIDARNRFARAARPVIARVGDDLEGNKIGLLVTDHRAQIVARTAGDRATTGLLDRVQLAPGFLYGEELVGTNAIGTAIESHGPAFVAGHEHFAEALTRMACAATTVMNPANGQVLGVIDLTCSVEDANPLMLPLVKRAAWEIEQRLLEDSSVDERILQEHFLRARRSSREPLLALNQHTLLMNAAAAGVVEPGDRELLWDGALEVVRDSRQQAEEVVLPNGRSVTVRFEPLLEGTRLAGVLARLGPVAHDAEGAQSRRRGASAFGWSSLTDTECAVAAQVAEGLTNREAAARLYLSPHTIDFHLRQLFRKLGVRSRVDLTRVFLRNTQGPA